MAQYTVEELDALLRAIATGARRVKYRDREVEYRSLMEMRGLAEEMRRDLGLSETGLKITYFQTKKGL